MRATARNTQCCALQCCVRPEKATCGRGCRRARVQRFAGVVGPVGVQAYITPSSVCGLIGKRALRARQAAPVPHLLPMPRLHLLLMYICCDVSFETVGFI
jgi:hypothetical protein